MDDFEVDAEGGGVVDEVLAVAAVDPGFAQGGVVGGGLLQEGAADGGILLLAAVTSAASSRPRVSMTMLRLRPTIFMPASMPWLRAGTRVEVLTLCASITQADGWRFLRSCR
ncbi:hypothetical protein J7I97_26990 [Streptomyces sp. ISL-87]|nr:hypothetical protein [Streptomyces sp. ISL-21]MBT2454582.1 hypothetical protein [Streptomyces sp. ISL-86]MBT2611801.1 hypothetical protein [Streptomyces sp. ISL-87]